MRWPHYTMRSISSRSLMEIRLIYMASAVTPRDVRVWIDTGQEWWVLPPRSCPWCRQHLHSHRRSQTFCWMWQSTLTMKPVLCSRTGFFMHWKRNRTVKKKITDKHQNDSLQFLSDFLFYKTVGRDSPGRPHSTLSIKIFSFLLVWANLKEVNGNKVI